MGLRTPLYSWHTSNQARIVDFAGWDMPVIYTSITEEHRATRQHAGLFDISHMGRLTFRGPHAGEVLEQMVTNRVDTLQPGQARYSLMLHEDGGTLDDVLVYRLPDRYLLVVNAGNRQRILEWSQKQSAGREVRIIDETLETAMIAVQGPQAVSLASKVLGEDFAPLRYFFAKEGALDKGYLLASRTGYTGEDGLELIVARDRATARWEQLVAAGARPCGLGARDTLRLEAAMPLYGHELSESIDPIQAGLAWAVKADVKDFIGKPALLEKDPDRPVRVGLRLADKRIAREGFAIVHEGRTIGKISSGTYAPTLEASIAMGYVPPEFARAGTALAVLVREQAVPAVVVPLPFYKRGNR